jgi:hypothetical protein
MAARGWPYQRRLSSAHRERRAMRAATPV